MTHANASGFVLVCLGVSACGGRVADAPPLDAPDSSIVGTSSASIAGAASNDSDVVTVSRASAGSWKVSGVRHRFAVPSDDVPPSSPVPPSEALRVVPSLLGPVPVFSPPRPGEPVSPSIVMPAHAAAPLRLELGSARLSVSLLDAAASPARLDTEGVVYPGAFEGASLLFIPQRVGVEELLVLDGPGLSVIRQQVDLLGLGGLRQVGSVLELLAQDGTPVFRTTAPTLVDADGHVARAELTVDGCAVDRDARAPRGRPITPAGASHCILTSRLPLDGLHYPILVDPAWTTTARMATPRFSHAAAAITGSNVVACAGGCVVVTGGRSVATTSEVLSSTELYDAQSATWSAGPDLPWRAQGHVLVDTRRGTVIAALGATNSTGSTVTNQSAMWSPDVGAWSLLNPLSEARYKAAAAFASDGSGSYIVVSGGQRGNSPGTASARVDYLVLNDAPRWAQGANLYLRRTEHAMAGYLDGATAGFVVAGGLIGNSPLATIEYISAQAIRETMYWEAPPEPRGVLPSGTRYGLAAVVLDDAVLFAGGYGSARYSAAVDRWLIGSRSPVPNASALASSRLGLKGVEVGTNPRRALFVGGQVGPQVTTGAMDLLSAAGERSSATAIHPRAGHQATALPGGAALITGGYETWVQTGSLATAPAHEEVFRFDAAGASCTADFECISGHCIDSVCCATDCTGQCRRCNVEGHIGTCTIVPAGGTPRTPCVGAGTVCGFSCNGIVGDQCTAAPITTQCGVATCQGGIEVQAQRCDGRGGCVPAETRECGNYLCGFSACLTSCRSTQECARGRYCDREPESMSFTQCVPEKTAGSPCAGDNECRAGFTCVDGVCCTSPTGCTPPRRCNVNPNAGTCLLPGGERCASDSECGSGHCVDGVCCNRDCNGRCEACDIAGNVGVCLRVNSGQPHGTRTPCAAASGPCQAQCDGSSDTECGRVPEAMMCSGPVCELGVQYGASTCSALGACVRPSEGTNCGNYVCGDGACKSRCSVDADCSPGYYCSNNTCNSSGGPGTACFTTAQCQSGLECIDRVCCKEASCADGLSCAEGKGLKCSKMAGAACSSNDECGSGYCVDGVCCDRACDQQCEACNIDKGRCTIKQGPPEGSRPPCSTSGICGAQCDGSHAASCGVPPGSDKECLAARCDGSSRIPASTCNQQGACVAQSPVQCSPYNCEGGRCKPTCASAADCSDSIKYVCKDGSCVTKGDLGTVCTMDEQCHQGTFCTDGGNNRRVCCQVRACENGRVCADDKAASELVGTCVNAPKQPCSSPAECANGLCIDGYCCNKECSGQCEACDVEGHEGECWPVTGPAHAPRPPCDGVDAGAVNPEVCSALGCNGSDTTKCQGLLYSEFSRKLCGGPRCDADRFYPGAHCDGMGGCREDQSEYCGPYKCDSNGCRKSCASDTDCATGAHCEQQQCVLGPSRCGSGDDSSIASKAVDPCGPYACNVDVGRCHETCATSAQCAGGFACKDAVCVSTTEATFADPGCACSVPGRPASRAAATWITFLAAATAGIRRSRRRARQKASSANTPSLGSTKVPIMLSRVTVVDSTRPMG